MDVEQEQRIEGSGFHIPSLNGLRTVAFMLVFVGHAGLDKLVPAGFGVTIFFFLSGYLITTLLRREVDRRKHLSFKRFYLRRVLRILPPFYLVLLGGLALTAAGLLTVPGGLDWGGVTAQFLHLTNYFQIIHPNRHVTPGSEVYWSLAVEEHFYLLFPLLYVGMRKGKLIGRDQARVILAICAAVLVWRCVLVFGLDSSVFRTYYATDTRIDSILFGCALGVYGNPMLDPMWLTERVWKRWLLPASLALLFFCLVYRNPDFRETFRYSLQGIGLYAIFYCAVRYPQWALMRWLNVRWVAFVGTLTYSLYLVHATVLLTLEEQFPGLPEAVRGAIGLGMSLLLAYAIYRLVERPIGRLRRRLEPA
ncbi:MAG TPA: acyltransferase [Acidimicrobiia bacterium]|nr:acyltransferase [Acidimicrobiia bacterium]